MEIPDTRRTWDGFPATFDGAAEAPMCASSIVERTEAQGIRIRAGVPQGWAPDRVVA